MSNNTDTATNGGELPSDEDGYMVRILTEPPNNRSRFSEWAEVGAFPGDVWELIGPSGDVEERYVNADIEQSK